MPVRCPIGEPPAPEYPVKPRKPAPAPDERPVLAAGRAMFIDEDTGELVERLAVELDTGRRIQWSEFVTSLPEHGPAIIVIDDPFDALFELDAYWTDHTHWNWTIYPQQREWEDTERSYAPPSVARFGFARYGQSRRARYFQVLCPARFSEAAGEMLAGASLEQLREFGRNVRDWCSEQQLSTRSSAASIGTAMLTDGRFKLEARRKVPGATNLRAREQLAGNLYRLAGDPARVYPTVRKADLSGAHHRAALAINFPDPDTLRAKGRWRLELPADGQPADDWADRPWAWRAPGAELDRQLSEHGLFLLVLRVPAPAGTVALTHPTLAKAGRVYRYVWSSELGYLLSRGAKVLAIVAQWTSPNLCEQLNEYALWALGELERRPDIREWLKPALLATYGVLAARPRRFRVAYRQATAGRPIAFPTLAGNMLEGVQYTTRMREARTANVIARGLIEASVRARVLDAAEQLARQGEHVLEVWADSIFLEGAGPPELRLEPAWRDEGTLTNVRFYDSTHVVGDGFVRLPGITGGQRDELASLRARETFERKAAP